MRINEKQALVFSLGIALMVIVVLVGVVIMSIHMQEFKEEYGLNRIQEIRIEGTDVHYEIYGALLNIDRSDYIFPKDFLQYKIIFQTKKEFPIELHTEVIIYAGNNNVTNTIILPIANFTSDERTNGVSLYYHAEELGRNTIFANFKFINSTNGILLKEFSKTTKYDVVTPDYALQDKANKNTNIALIVSVVVGVGTLIALVSSTLYSRSSVIELRIQNITLVQQNSELKEQHSIQNRPWVSIADVEPRYSLKPNMLEINIKNFGKSPAHNVISRSLVSDNEISKEDLDQFPFTDDSYSLAPNEIISIRRTIALDEYKMAHGSRSPLYFALELNYTYENNKTGKFVVFGNVNEGAGFAMTQMKKILE